MQSARTDKDLSNNNLSERRGGLSGMNEIDKTTLPAPFSVRERTDESQPIATNIEEEKEEVGKKQLPLPEGNRRHANAAFEDNQEQD